VYAVQIGRQLGLDEATLADIQLGRELHDIGKIGVRDSILLKPGPLTPEEWKEMKLHPEIGFRMLAKMPYLYEASRIVHQHQERWDGLGYPKGLKGEEIVIGARIFVIADTMDAITSDRPYRKGRPLQAAKDEIQRCAGTQFDPALVETYLKIPDSTWEGVRREVEQMEAAEAKRWGGDVLLGPGKRGLK